jgi:hypothetical protein
LHLIQVSTATFAGRHSGKYVIHTCMKEVKETAYCAVQPPSIGSAMPRI